MQSLNTSRDDFPTSLILISDEEVYGHVKLSRVPSMCYSCIIESGELVIFKKI